MDQTENERKLPNGINIPELAFGTFRLDNTQKGIDAVYNAIKYGYRHIDTEFEYGCEFAVGLGIKKAIDEGIVKREDLFVTTKLMPLEQGYDSTLKNFKQSLENLGLEYVDLYLIHRPLYENIEWKKYAVDTWRAFEKLYRDGKVKAIGVSNFQIHRLKYLLSEAEIMPMVNQIELHPQHQQKELVDFCKKNNIFVTAWGALNQGRIFQVDLFEELSKKYNKTIPQIALKWSLQKEYVPIAFADTVSFINENRDVYDFQISEADMNRLDSLDGGAFSGWHNDILAENQSNGCIKTVKLFSFVPIIKIRETEDKAKYSFFGLIPLLKIQKKPLFNHR